MAEAGTVNAEDRRPPGLGSGEMALQAFLRAAEACGGVCAVSFPGRVLREPALVKGGFPSSLEACLKLLPQRTETNVLDQFPVESSLPWGGIEHLLC